MKKLLDCLLAPIQTKVFYLFLIFNLISNGACIYYYPEIKDITFVIILSFFYAYIETAIFKILRPKWLKELFLVIVCILYNIFILVDYFLIHTFQKIFQEGIMDIFLETNRQEVTNFLETYVSKSYIVFIILSLIVLNIVIIYLCKILIRVIPSKISLIISSLGILLFFYMCYSFARYRNGMGMPQYASVTRFAHTLNLAHNRLQQTEQLRKICGQTTATCQDTINPTVVVIIGETHSVYHSSIYGYRLETNPHIQKRLAEGNLYMFDDVVTIDDHTMGVMKSVFSLDSLGTDFNDKPLFPACFKAAGFHTALYDNQYFVGTGISFLSDKKLSNMLFDERNTKQYQYDGEMVDDITLKDVPSLYVIHLIGQHFAYWNRYPEDYMKFSPKYYDRNKYSRRQREAMAHYDNACLYNDYVIEKIISKFEDKNAIIFYFSDHGEELYELRDYMGHCTAAYSPDLRYQMRVPLLIYVSDSYKQSHADFCNRLERNQHTPIITDDISHVILNAASIQTESFSKYRCFTDSAYKKDKPRMVLHSIDYNNLK